MPDALRDQSLAVLNCPMDANDAGAATVRNYLVALVREVWREGEGFSGKRPFGNSSWEYEVYGALVKAGLVAGSFDADGYIEDVESARADSLVMAAIEALGSTDA